MAPTHVLFDLDGTISDSAPGILAALRHAFAVTANGGGMFDTAVYPGVAGLITGLAGRGVTLAVATSKPESYARPILEHLGLDGCFATIGGDALDGSLGTKALVIGLVLDRLGNPDPAEVVMIGDRSHDVLGARAHGIDTVAVTWGYAVPGELEAAEPRWTCVTAGEVAEVLGAAGE